MMMGFFAGYLGSDPEERFTANGKRVVVLRLAVKTRQSGKEETVWCKCNIWHDRFDNMLPYLKKGSALIVSGEIGVDGYLSRDGSPQASLLITADTLKFNPFGKNDRSPSDATANVAPSTEKASHAMMNEQETPVYATVLGDDESPYANDDIPF
ncbi:Single-stranded DNA-binding protein [Candidatus Clavichlamydia salmonicola]|uniref:single-stranded DNA-binding protein n=1 Tax=Candidatus Clavichlamydia salmonicola TaxID=469812 RepID=UPI001891608C|nr:single-stranded DNA-binding protein [Candidatus Clavichlamydia salmonicola]MBF5051149.1 Single-stranded DNA-binding protein [Candidatus Clavichlamydia salmonicola]